MGVTGLLADWHTQSATYKQQLLQRVQEERARRMRALWQPYAWQRPHEHEPGYSGVCGPWCADLPALKLTSLQMWLMMGGRGTGKTDGGAEYVLDHVYGPACDPRAPGGHRVAIVAPTQGDAVSSCVNGISGLIAHDPRVKLRGSREGAFALFPNGARARLFGAHTPDDVERLRAGGNNCLVWLEEAAAQRHLGAILEHSAFGLRVGPAPHYIATTTPKARKEVTALLEDASVHITRGRTRDAHHLGEEFREKIEAKYAGTRTGRQELDGEVLADVEGALWKRALIELERIPEGTQPPLRRVVVAVDPNAGGKDECGIVVVGLSRERYPDAKGRLQLHVYVLEDASGHYSGPEAWAARACRAYHQWSADSIVAEVNNGGDMVPAVIRTADKRVPVRVVHATRGKVVRAEPVVMLYEQARAHHVGSFPQLEDQQCTWTLDNPDSPDRMDALVWGITDLAGLASGDGSSFEMI